MLTARDRPPEEAAEDTSFARGLRVFLTIADRGEIRADELATLLETPLSTVYRYLRTLTEFGFVERMEGGYKLGPRLHLTGGTTVSSEELIRHADPVLRMLVDEAGETAVIARRVGLSSVCLHEVQSGHALRVTCEPGSATPLVSGAIAKVLLAYAPAEIQDEVLAEVANAKALRRELATVLEDGIARSEGELFSGTVDMAVPILRDDGIVAAIGVVAPAERATLPWRARASRLLADGAAAITESLRDYIG
ncbi:MAG: Transcriptional regulator, IclR family [Chloroflexota bacterium]|nr:Transcriptional regulator, IclR family [Chloroflexota bacterium]